MINRNNIVEYIKFLYEKKHDQPATQELLDSWSDLNDNETAIHLNGLYRHWNLDPITCKRYEEEFLNKSTQAHTPIIPKILKNQAEQQRATPQTPPPVNTYSQPPAPARKRSGRSVLYILLVLIVLGGAGYYIWELNDQSTDAPPEVTATDSANVNVQVAEPVTKPIEPAKPEETEADKKNARVIHDLMYAESSRNFESIYNSFDPNMERYWDINFPTYDEIKTRYEHTWEITENNEHQNVRVNKVAENTYDVMSTYSYYSLKDEKQKRVDSKVRFVFSDNNKVIKTYGL